MNFTKLKVIALLPFALCIENQPAAHTFIRRLGTGLSVGLPFAFASHGIYSYISRRSAVDKNPDLLFTKTSPQVQAWVRKEAALSTHSKIEVYALDDWFLEDAGACYPNIIYLPSRNTQAIEMYMNRYPEVSWHDNSVHKAPNPWNDQIAFIKYAIQHELGHLYYQDTAPKNKILPMLCAPAIIQALSYGMSKFRMQQQAPLLTTRAKICFLLSGVALGIGKQTCSELLQTAHQRHREKRADQFACTHVISPHVLRGAARRFEDIINTQLQLSRGSPKVQLVKLLHQRLFSTHPPIFERVKKLRDRANKLEANKLETPSSSSR